MELQAGPSSGGSLSVPKEKGKMLPRHLRVASGDCLLQGWSFEQGRVFFLLLKQ